MAHLYQHLRVHQVSNRSCQSYKGERANLLSLSLHLHQIFGANTDVGKTIFSTALCLASSSVDSKVHYLKPVSTGAANDADDL